MGHQSFTLDSKRNFQDNSGNACARKICSLIGLERTRQLHWFGFIERQPKNDSQSTSLPPPTPQNDISYLSVPTL
jgi:hypothetical protein